MSTELLSSVSYVELTGGKQALTDSKLKGLVSRFSWHLHNKGYACRGYRCGGKYKVVYMHRYIYEEVYGNIPDGYEIDHINGDRLDNRVENLRTATRRENQQNKKCHREGTTTSPYMGVHAHRCGSKSWRAAICIQGRQISVGFFNTEEEARDAYQQALENYRLYGTLPQKGR